MMYIFSIWARVKPKVLTTIQKYVWGTNKKRNWHSVMNSTEKVQINRIHFYFTHRFCRFHSRFHCWLGAGNLNGVSNEVNIIVVSVLQGTTMYSASIRISVSGCTNRRINDSHLGSLVTCSIRRELQSALTPKGCWLEIVLVSWRARRRHLLNTKSSSSIFIVPWGVRLRDTWTYC